MIKSHWRILVWEFVVWWTRTCRCVRKSHVAGSHLLESSMTKSRPSKMMGDEISRDEISRDGFSRAGIVRDEISGDEISPGERMRDEVSRDKTLPSKWCGPNSRVTCSTGDVTHSFFWGLVHPVVAPACKLTENLPELRVNLEAGWVFTRWTVVVSAIVFRWPLFYSIMASKRKGRGAAYSGVRERSCKVLVGPEGRQRPKTAVFADLGDVVSSYSITRTWLRYSTIRYLEHSHMAFITL